MKHPLWMTAKNWLKSQYFKEYSEDGRYRVLFGVGGQANTCETFPIYPVLQLMFRVPNGNFYQPYYCPESKTYWIYCCVVDHSLDMKIKSAAEIHASQMAFAKYSAFHWTDKQLQDAKIDLTVEYIDKADGKHKKCRRTSLTAEELKRLCDKTEDMVRHSSILRSYGAKIRPWILETPHIEKPIKIYVAGCDDSSYTEILPTLKSALQKIEKFKKKPPARPWDDAVFTN